MDDPWADLSAYCQICIIKGHAGEKKRQKAEEGVFDATRNPSRPELKIRLGEQGRDPEKKH